MSVLSDQFPDDPRKQPSFRYTKPGKQEWINTGYGPRMKITPPQEVVTEPYIPSEHKDAPYYTDESRWN